MTKHILDAEPPADLAADLRVLRDESAECFLSIRSER